MVMTCLMLAAMAYHRIGLYEADEISDGQLAAAAKPGCRPLVPPPCGAAITRRHGTRAAQLRATPLPCWYGRTTPCCWTPTVSLTQLGTPAAGYLTTSVEVHGELHHWRLFTLQMAQGTSQRRVTTVMDLDARFELGRDIAINLARPAFIVLPLVALLLA